MLEQIERIGQEITASLAEIDSKKNEKIKEISQAWSEKNRETIEHEGKNYTYQERYSIALKQRERILERINSETEEKLSTEEIIRMGETLRVLEDFINKYRKEEEIFEQRRNEANIVKGEKASVIKNGINSVISAIEAEIAELVAVRSSIDLSGDVEDFSQKLEQLNILNENEKELRRFLAEMNNLLSYNGAKKDLTIVDLIDEDYMTIVEEFYNVINNLEINMSEVVVEPKKGFVFDIEEDIILDMDQSEQEDNDKVARIDDMIAEVKKSSKTYSELAIMFEEMLENSRTIKNEELSFEKTKEIEELREILIETEITKLIGNATTYNDNVEKIEKLMELLSESEFKKIIEKRVENIRELEGRINEINKKLDNAADESISLEERVQSLDEAFNLIEQLNELYDEEKVNYMIDIDRIESIEQSINKKTAEQEDDNKVARINEIISEVNKSSEKYSKLADKFDEMLTISKTIANEELRLEKNKEILKLRDSSIEEEIETMMNEFSELSDLEEFKSSLELIKSLMVLISDEETKETLKKNIEDSEEFVTRIEEIRGKTEKVSDTSLPLAQRKKCYEEVVKLSNELVNDFEVDEDEFDTILLKLEEELEKYEEKYNAIKAEVEAIIADKKISDYDSVLAKVETLGAADKIALEKELKDFYDSFVEEFEELISKCEEQIINHELIDEEDVVLIGNYYVNLPTSKAEVYKGEVKAIISYHNKIKQNEVHSNYEIKKDSFFTKVGKVVTFVKGSKVATNVRLRALDFLRAQQEDVEDFEEEEKLEEMTSKVESKLVKSSVIGGLRLYAAQRKLEKLKTKLYDAEKFNGYSVKKQNRLLRKEQKALGTIERQMVKGLNAKTAINPVSKEYATSIIDQYLYLISTARCKDEEGNFDLSEHIDSLRDYLAENENLFTETELKAIRNQIHLIREYRESYDGEIYEITSSVNDDGELITELDDIVRYYDSEEYKNMPSYIKR